MGANIHRLTDAERDYLAEKLEQHLAGKPHAWIRGSGWTVREELLFQGLIERAVPLRSFIDRDGFPGYRLTPAGLDVAQAITDCASSVSCTHTGDRNTFTWLPINLSQKRITA